MVQLQKSVRTILRNCLNLKPKENLTIVTHESLSEIGESIWTNAQKITKNLILIKYKHQNLITYKIPEIICPSLSLCNAGIIVTPYYLDEKLFDKIRRDGSRIFVVQNASQSLLERSFETDYNKVSNLSRKLADLFSIGKTLHLKSPSGTEAHISISKAKGLAETGVAQNPGEFTSFPAGEACIFLNNSLDGRITLDRIAGVKRKLAKPVILNVNKGYITQIKGQKDAEKLRKNIRKFGKNGRKIYEFGIGTNDKVVFGNSAQEDEKFSGAVHISFGKNQVTKSQGKMLQAIKGIILRPTLSIDSKLIIENGIILV